MSGGVMWVLWVELSMGNRGLSPVVRLWFAVVRSANG